MHYISAIQCEAGLSYKPCIDVCDYRKCDHPFQNSTDCPISCVEGCGCEPHQVLKDGSVLLSLDDDQTFPRIEIYIVLFLLPGKCIDAKLTTCTDPLTGIEYEQGAVIEKDCEQW